MAYTARCAWSAKFPCTGHFLAVHGSFDWLFKGQFTWTRAGSKSFDHLKRLTATRNLALLDFDKVFQVDCDSSHVGIGAVLSKEGRSIAYYSRSLNGPKLHYSTYDIEFYAIVQALRHWWHYIVQNEFVLCSNHKALKYLNEKQKWVAGMQNGQPIFKN